jgi:hypothetical protein
MNKVPHNRFRKFLNYRGTKTFLLKSRNVERLNKFSVGGEAEDIDLVAAYRRSRFAEA